MKCLLDTHVFLWWLSGDKLLAKNVVSVISDVNNTVYVSAVSIWEISIKQALGKLKAPLNLENELEQEGFDPLAIQLKHAALAGNLPLHHRDPFDRMLVAQATLEECTLITANTKLKAYEANLLLVD